MKTVGLTSTGIVLALLWAAAMAMQGMLANSAEGNTEWDYNTIAKHSCIAADALVEQMNIK